MGHCGLVKEFYFSSFLFLFVVPPQERMYSKAIYVSYLSINVFVSFATVELRLIDLMLYSVRVARSYFFFLTKPQLPQHTGGFAAFFKTISTFVYPSCTRCFHFGQVIFWVLNKLFCHLLSKLSSHKVSIYSPPRTYVTYCCSDGLSSFSCDSYRQLIVKANAGFLQTFLFLIVSFHFDDRHSCII